MKKDPYITLARDLRLEETHPEQIVWSWLRAKQQGGMKFRRQQPIGKYIVDFVCFEKKVVIELDGGQHNEDEFVTKDSERTVWLNSQGFEVLRFWNNEVLENMDGVLLRIKSALGIDVSPSP